MRGRIATGSEGAVTAAGELGARALWIESPGHASLRQERLAAPGPAELQVRTLYSAISRGTETLVFGGRVPPSEYRRMQAPFQAGVFPGPVKYGYANVGVVEAGPATWQGRKVFCLYPHQTRYCVAPEAVVAIPDDVPPARAVLAANMETAVNALWDAAPRVGDRISVVGAGVLGCLVAHLCARIPGVQVELVDIRPERARVAQVLQVNFARPDEARGERDLVFHASASGEGLNTALGLAGREAEVMELSWYGTRSVTVNLGGSFHSQRLNLRASQVGTVSPARAARRSHHDRLSLAVALCADMRLDVLFAPDVAFSLLPGALARLADPGDGTLCQRVTYQEES